jgi:D-tyrosyl-tRNA(Tyr) deacylase
MRAVIQRVSRSSVQVNEAEVGAIGRGVMVLLGIGPGDSEEHARALARKVTELRIFPDEYGKMNHSLLDVGGEALVISQFTLYGDTSKGRRPSFVGAAPPAQAIPLYERFIALLRESGVRHVAHGVFGADMQVSLVNDGPVTLILESP